MTKLTLTNIDTSGYEGHPPLGIAYIASYLRKYLDFKNIHIVAKEKNLFKTIKKSNPDILGVSAATINMPKALELAKKVKKELNIPILIGGAHITALPHTLPKMFDVGVIGEGEETMLELMKLWSKKGEFKSFDLKKIKGLVFRDSNQIKQTNRRKLIESLDDIPIPARDLLNMKVYLIPLRVGAKKKFRRSTHILTSRGCPFSCVYCASSVFWGRRIRYHSAKRVFKEITELIEKYNVNHIAIFDDLFAANLPRLKKIVQYIIKNKLNEKVEFGCLSRADILNDERCKLLKKMGVTSVCIGLESASPKVLGYLKNNTTTPKQNMLATKTCAKYGMEIGGSFMLGSPHETKEDAMVTLDFIKKAPITSGAVYTTTPLPGTKLWSDCKKRGLVSDNMDWNKLHLQLPPHKHVYVGDKMTRKEFIEMHKKMCKVLELKNLSTNLELKNIKLLFSLPLWKKAISRPYETLKIIKNSLVKK